MEESTALTIRDTMEVAERFAKSGLFPQTAAEQAFVKIMAGQELGIPPFAAMTGIHVIQGKASLGAGIIAGRIKASSKYDYRVLQHDDEGCVIAFYQGTAKLGESAFQQSDAKAAGVLGKDNWKKYPRNMYFARAISNGARWFCPDVTAGPVYTPEELGGVVDAEIVDVTPKSQLGSLDDIFPMRQGDDGGVELIIEPEATPETVVVEAPEPFYGNNPGPVWGWLKEKKGLTSDDMHDAGIHLRNFQTREDLLAWAAGPECEKLQARVKAANEEVARMEERQLEQLEAEQEAML